MNLILKLISTKPAFNFSVLTTFKDHILRLLLIFCLFGKYSFKSVHIFATSRRSATGSSPLQRIEDGSLAGSHTEDPPIRHHRTGAQLHRERNHPHIQRRWSRSIKRGRRWRRCERRLGSSKAPRKWRRPAKLFLESGTGNLVVWVRTKSFWWGTAAIQHLKPAQVVPAFVGTKLEKPIDRSSEAGWSLWMVFVTD